MATNWKIRSIRLPESVWRQYDQMAAEEMRSPSNFMTVTLLRLLVDLGRVVEPIEDDEEEEPKK